MNSLLIHQKLYNNNYYDFKHLNEVSVKNALFSIAKSSRYLQVELQKVVTFFFKLIMFIGIFLFPFKLLATCFPCLFLLMPCCRTSVLMIFNYCYKHLKSTKCYATIFQLVPQLSRIDICSFYSSRELRVAAKPRTPT